MPNISEKGAIHLLIPLLLIGGIIVTVWLITAGPLKLLPKAANPISGPIPTQTPRPLPTATPANLVNNPSFETNDKGINGYPAQWWRRAQGSWDNTTYHTGQASLKLTATGSNKDGIYTQQYTALEPSTTYNVSYWVKAQNVTGFGVGMRYAQLEPTTQVFWLPGHKSYVTGTQDWKQYTYTFTTPADYKSGRLDILWQIDSGIAWIDDISLSK